MSTFSYSVYYILTFLILPNSLKGSNVASISEERPVGGGGWFEISSDFSFMILESDSGAYTYPGGYPLPSIMGGLTYSDFTSSWSSFYYFCLKLFTS